MYSTNNDEDKNKVQAWEELKNNYFSVTLFF